VSTFWLMTLGAAVVGRHKGARLSDRGERTKIQQSERERTLKKESKKQNNTESREQENTTEKLQARDSEVYNNKGGDLLAIS